MKKIKYIYYYKYIIEDTTIEIGVDTNISNFKLFKNVVLGGT